MHKRIVFIFVVISVCALSLQGVSSLQLQDFGQVLNALKSGSPVNAVFHYKECTLIIDGKEIEEIPDAIGGMEIATWEYFAPGSIGNEIGYIAASQNILIHHPRYGFVYNYVKLNIYQDNTIKIIAKYLEPGTLEVKMDESFHTHINDGKKGAAYFYKASIALQ